MRAAPLAPRVPRRPRPECRPASRRVPEIIEITGDGGHWPVPRGNRQPGDPGHALREHPKLDSSGDLQLSIDRHQPLGVVQRPPDPMIARQPTRMVKPDGSRSGPGNHPRFRAGCRPPRSATRPPTDTHGADIMGRREPGRGIQASTPTKKAIAMRLLAAAAENGSCRIISEVTAQAANTVRPTAPTFQKPARSERSRGRRARSGWAPCM